MKQATLPIFPEPNIELLQGDCLEVMRGLEGNSIDCIVTDPPYALEFMGKGWDKVLPSVEVWEECLRVAKPGAMLLAFGGTRTYHRLTCAIEDAGWEIRDCVMYVYGSGFPKSHNISKAIDKMKGTEKIIGKGKAGKTALGQSSSWNKTYNPHEYNITEPNCPEAKKYDGYGTALKPAYEPIVLAMKPLDGTFAENVLKWGVGGLNIDGCRVGYPEGDDAYQKGIDRAKQPRADIRGGGFHTGTDWGKKKRTVASGMKPQGRWPANVIHDGSEEVVSLFPETGKSTGGMSKGGMGKRCYGKYKLNKTAQNTGGLGDSGSAARFFYCAKASKAERNMGCEELKPKQRDLSRKKGNVGGDNPRNRGVKKVLNNHPTVKPLKLMEYLVTLLSPPENGSVIDPYMGSGTTGIACKNLGYDFIGIEIDKEYFKIAKKRINHVEKSSSSNNAYEEFFERK